MGGEADAGKAKETGQEGQRTSVGVREGRGEKERHTEKERKGRVSTERQTGDIQTGFSEAKRHH